MTRNEIVNVEPVVKWSGSKRSQAVEIVKRMPKEIDTYYEPFCGGCSVLYRLLQTPSVKVKRYIASDINADLIRLWIAIKNNQEVLSTEYKKMWAEFNKLPIMQSKEGFSWRKEFFYKIRERLNREHRPSDFLFIMRTTTNGMPRYNDKGEFNNSCHFSRPGINPCALSDVLQNWSFLLRTKDVEFISQPFDRCQFGDKDFCYMDPPYAGTKGMYYGGINLSYFFTWLRYVPCRWMLSFNGKRGGTDNTFSVPKSLYVCHEYLNAGNSSFERYLGNKRTGKVYESLYMNYEKKREEKEMLQGELL